MLNLRRALLMSLLAAASCEAGPTSDWPSNGSDDDDQDDDGTSPPRADAGSVGTMDAGRRDASVPTIEDTCRPDAGDAGADAGCLERDE